MKHHFLMILSVAATLNLGTIIAQEKMPPPPPPLGQGVRGAGGQGQGQGQRMSIEDRQKQEITWMKENLKITEDQEKKIVALNKVAQEQMQKMRQQREAGAEVDRDAMREQMRAAREKHQTELKSILSEEQYAKFQKMQDERREKMRQSRNGGNNAPQDSSRRQRGRGANAN